MAGDKLTPADIERLVIEECHRSAIGMATHRDPKHVLAEIRGAARTLFERRAQAGDEDAARVVDVEVEVDPQDETRVLITPIVRFYQIRVRVVPMEQTDG